MYQQYHQYMESKTMAIRAVRDQLGKRVDAAHDGSEATVVTTNGEARAVIVPYSWWKHATTNGQPQR